MGGQSLSENERRASLRLARTPNVGPVTFAGLLARFGSAEAALEAVPQLARRGGAAGRLKIPADGEAERELEAIAQTAGPPACLHRSGLPAGLAALEAPPPVLTVLGHAVVLTREMVAVVGARNASALGRKLAARLATDLGAAGLAVASGMARGIDAAAHDGALATGTAAVLAGGADVVYPPENQALYERLCAEGAVVSEMPWAQAPQARHFPRRNRIISGLSRGVVDRRGGRRLRLADHRQLCARTGTRDLRRARLTAGPARQGHQPADPRRRHPDRDGRRYPRRAATDPGPSLRASHLQADIGRRPAMPRRSMPKPKPCAGASKSCSARRRSRSTSWCARAGPAPGPS